MKMWNFARLMALMVLGLTSSNQSLAQPIPVYGNEWLANRYSQQWIRIPVLKKGIHSVALTGDFIGKPNRLHLFHRGVEVALTSATGNTIEFYGVPNDGSSDVLLYRPESSRTNPYYSTYSDESSYFLTFDLNDNNPTLLAQQETLVPSGTPLTSHIQKDLRTYATEHPQMTSWAQRPSTLNSFFELGESGMGSRMAVLNTMYTANFPSTKYTSPANVGSPFDFNVKVPSGSGQRTMEVMVRGGFLDCVVEVYVGKTSSVSDLRLVGSVSLTPEVNTKLAFNLQDADYNAAGGVVGFKKTSGGGGSAFRVGYFTLAYSQLIDMQNLNSYQFNFPATTPGTSRITVANPAAGITFYNVTNVDRPKIINGAPADLMFSRDDKELILLATNEKTVVDPTRITTCTFQDMNPADFDYLIVRNQTLKTSAEAYANYREKLTPGKKYRPLVKDIRDIYNQFNYGEPSPVAIRRYVEYMISDKNKNKFLLLIGKSVTFYEKVTREMPDEVPTVGFPGSDLLLVDGLGGEVEDVPAIPVGRIGAISNEQVLAYLAKVTTYEAETDLAYRKRVIHMSGGKSQDEVTSFANSIGTVTPDVTAAPFLGTVIQKVKPDAANVTTDVSLAPEMNGAAVSNGVGMITYLGHGSTTETDYNAGFMTDASRGYNNSKYPLVYYTGCGVNNIFSNFNEVYASPPSNFSRAMSLDWLLTPNKGAIAVMGNTWDAYESTVREYMNRLYPYIFSVNDASRMTIGEILKQTALLTKNQTGYVKVPGVYDQNQANIHQTILQGDPAMKILQTEAPLPVDLISFNARVMDARQVEVLWKTASERNNSHFVVERSDDAKTFNQVGLVEGKGDSNAESNYTFFDTAPLSGISYYRLSQVDKNVTVSGKVIEGKVSYSKIVSVNRPGADLLVVSPNPSSEKLEIKLDATAELKSWNLFDMQGKSILKDRTGSVVLISNLPSGDYILEVLTRKGDSYRKKIVKF